MNNQKEVLGIFIDEANIYYSQKTLGWKIDYQKLKSYLKEYGDTITLNFYTSYQDDNKKQNDFLEKLKQYGYKIISKKLKIIRNKNGSILKKGNLDIELALDVYRFKNKFETLILFSGDSDFAYLLHLLKQRSKRIIVCSTGGHVSKEILDLADVYIDLKKIKIYLSR